MTYEQLTASYEAWDKLRKFLSKQEEQGDYPDPDDWQASDDEAVYLLREAMTFLSIMKENERRRIERYKAGE